MDGRTDGRTDGRIPAYALARHTSPDRAMGSARQRGSIFLTFPRATQAGSIELGRADSGGKRRLDCNYQRRDKARSDERLSALALSHRIVVINDRDATGIRLLAEGERTIMAALLLSHYRRGPIAVSIISRPLHHIERRPACGRCTVHTPVHPASKGFASFPSNPISKCDPESLEMPITIECRCVGT